VTRAFEERAASYYADNYMPGMNAQRSNRLNLVRGLFSQLARPGDRLLDVGAGPAILGEVAQSQGLQYVAVDLSLENLLVGRSRMGQLSGIVATATALPMKDQSFDGVVSLGCLEYVDQLEAAVAELCRTVTPGGFLLASFANRRSPRCRWDERVTHPLWRLRERAAGRASSVYRRHLRNEHEVEEMFARCGAKVLRTLYFNPGLLGYPLSAISLVASIEERAAGGIEVFRRRAAEFLIVAVREEEEG
jgi:ubiquinone/menaquinone biosynthesis C-methylase UbiE